MDLSSQAFREVYAQAKKLMPDGAKGAVLNGRPMITYLPDGSFYYARESRVGEREWRTAPVCAGEPGFRKRESAV